MNTHLQQKTLHSSQDLDTQHRNQDLADYGRAFVEGVLHAPPATPEPPLAGAVLPVPPPEGRPALAAAGELLLVALAPVGPARGLLVSGGNDLGGQGQVGPEVLDALGGEVDVVVLPAERDLDVSPALEGLHEVEHLEVRASLDLGMGGGHGVLLHDEHSLSEEVREDGDAVGLGDEHGGR